MKLILDIGATNFRIARCSKEVIFDKQVVNTPKKKKDILKLIFDMIDSYSGMNSISIGLAGLINKGVVTQTPNMDFSNVRLKEILIKKYKIRTYLENDANCAALAEKYYGAVKNRKNAVILTLGTGIGGGIIINGKLYKGRGFAGEPGQMFLNGNLFERIASGSAVDFFKKKYKLKDCKKINLIYKEIGENLGKGIVNILYLLNPEIVILSGGFSNVREIYPSLIETVRKSYKIDNIPIVHSCLKGNEVLLGASVLFRVN